VRRWVAALAAVGAGCATGLEAPVAPPATENASPVALRNAGFEEPMPAGDRCPRGWGCTMHNDPDSFRFYLVEGAAAEGRRMLCVERVANEPWALATQGVAPAGLRGTRVRLSMAVRGEGLSGPGVGPWILVDGRPRVHESRVVKAAARWQRLAVELTVPAGAQSIEVGATLEGGGKACLDDVRLEVVPAPKVARP
jgi:hypothetical protein